MLDPDVVLRADGGGDALLVVKGAREVANRARLAAGGRRVHAVIVDGAAGFVATEAGVPVAVLAFRVAGGRITRIDALGGSRLAGLGLEAFASN